jgi:hypothetical protein
VATGLANFFTHLALDLQGIELKSPTLQLHQRDEARGDHGDLLDIGMKLRLRSFPPVSTPCCDTHPGAGRVWS